MRLKKTDGRMIAGGNVSHQLVEAMASRPLGSSCQEGGPNSLPAPLRGHHQMLNPTRPLPSLEPEVNVSPDDSLLASHQETGTRPPVVHQTAHRLGVGGVSPAGQTDGAQSEGECAPLLPLPKLPGMGGGVGVIEGHTTFDVGPINAEDLHSGCPFR
jgi:hypothetical protein